MLLSKTKLDTTYKLQIDQLYNRISKEETLDNSNVSVLTGELSKAIFYAHYAKLRPELKPQLENQIDQVIQRNTTFIEQNTVEFCQVDGLAGFGWGISYLAELGFLKHDENEFLQDLDEYLFEVSMQAMKSGHYDFFYGGIGYGNYFLQRSKNNPAFSVKIEQLVDALYSHAKTTNNMLYWQTEDDLENDVLDLSLSHGASSIIMFFTKVLSAGIKVDLCSSVIEKLAIFILSKQISDTQNRIRIPDYIEKQEIFLSPLRWCHGDMGTSIALGFAGKAIQNKDIISLSKTISTGLCQERLTSEQELISTTLCHGTLGVAHMFSTLAKIHDNETIYRETADYWYEETLNMMETKIGYQYYDEDAEYREKTGLLHGLEGVGLAALNVLLPKESAWDACLLLS